MPANLIDFLPSQAEASGETILSRFLDFLAARNVELYPAQETAILELCEDKNVILNTPTGSGKTLVATAAQFGSLARGRRSIYTCPIKALVNEKWLSLCREFGAKNVGLSTGDATVNHGAPILCCTAEILANMALREGDQARIDEVIIDEFHYYSDRDRGGAWQIPLLTLPQARFLLMSATMGDTDFFAQSLSQLTHRPTVIVQGSIRPVPLEQSYVETTLTATLERLLADGKAPIYVVHFSQAEAAESAQSITSLNVCTRDEKAAVAEALQGVKFSSPYGPEVKRWLRHGIGVHHAGLLPKYRILVEQLAQKGLLKVICGTDTLGVGINVPIRTVVFTKLCKYDGQKTAILSVRDFHQIAGRAGRKGFDDCGWVVVQAPEHVVENLKLEEKAARDGKKVVKRKPPEKNFVAWDKNTFQRLVNSAPEKLTSQFKVSHGMLLNVLSRPSNGCDAMRRLIRDCHESPKAKKQLTKRSWQLFRSLLAQKIVEILPKTSSGAYLRVNIDLQSDFSMNQTLSLFLIHTIPQLDAASPSYPLDLLTLVESIIEDPDVILRKQLDRVKSERLAEMKMEGMDYDQRMAELELLEYPKPNREFIYSTFNAFASQHPWVDQENIRPKSIVREMFEGFRTFSDYIKDYELQRAEGVLLRHLMAVHKVLAQTVPDSFKNEAVQEMETFLDTMIRQVDSSLIEEWERMRNPSYVAPQNLEEVRLKTAAVVVDITADKARFHGQIRQWIWTFLRNLSSGDIEAAQACLAFETTVEELPIDPEMLSSHYQKFTEARGRLCFDAEARNQRHTYILEGALPNQWKVQQMLVDPHNNNDWVADFVVDLPESKLRQGPALRFGRIGPLVP